MRKRIISLLLVLTCTFGAVGQVQATTIEEAKQKDAELQSQKKAAESEKAALVNRLNQLITELDAANKKVSEKQEEIDEKETELILAQIDENNQYLSMKKRIKYMYENGNTQFIQILLESKSIGDFLNNAEYVLQISEYDRNMLNEFQETVKKVDKQKKALEEEKAELEELQTDLQVKQSEVSTLVSEKSAQISDLNAAIGANADKLEKLIAAAAEEKRRQEEAAAAQRPSNSGSSNSGGSGSGGGGTTVTPVPPITPSGTYCNPCPSAYISSTFGGRVSPGGIGSTNHKGTDYAAPSGSAIFAIAGGTVTTAGYNGVRGNYLVINHGNGISSLYQHCSALLVSAGQSVSGGQNIATVGSTGASTGPHLHFEYWINGVPVDSRYYVPY